MGFRFKASSWRAPLQIIDSFLPQRGVHVTPRPPGNEHAALRLFRKAGWLGGRPIPAVAANDVCFAEASRAAEAVSGRNLRPVRVVRVAQGADLGGQETRLVISGRMSDVCAELDRLAAMESRMASA